jgi:hypothetical protein
MEFLASAGGDSLKRIVLNMIVLSLYIGLPMLWSIMMAMVGIQFGMGIHQAKSSALDPAQRAGAAGATAAGTLISKNAAKIARKKP